MGKKPKILVVGSLVMDLTVSTRRFPEPGETVLGSSFQSAPGGKGANQAIQAARLGADAVVGIDVDYEVLGSDNGMLMVTVSGTAVSLS